MNPEEIIKKYKIDFNSEPKHLSFKSTIALIESSYSDKSYQTLKYAEKREDFEKSFKDFFQYSVLDSLQAPFIYQAYETLEVSLNHIKAFNLVIPKNKAIRMMLLTDDFKSKVKLLEYIQKKEEIVPPLEVKKLIDEAVNRNFEINLDLLSCLSEFEKMMKYDLDNKGNLLVFLLPSYCKHTKLYEKIKEMGVKWEENKVDFIQIFESFLKNPKTNNLHYSVIIEISRDLLKFDYDDILFNSLNNSMAQEKEDTQAKQKFELDFIELEKIKIERTLTHTKKSLRHKI